MESKPYLEDITGRRLVPGIFCFILCVSFHGSLKICKAVAVDFGCRTAFVGIQFMYSLDGYIVVSRAKVATRY